MAVLGRPEAEFVTFLTVPLFRVIRVGERSYLALEIQAPASA